jgi:hypothetical protein
MLPSIKERVSKGGKNSGKMQTKDFHMFTAVCTFRDKVYYFCTFVYFIEILSG